MSESKELLILVSGASKTVRAWAGHKNLGCLLTPQTGNKPPVDLKWAADNAAYSNWCKKKFVAMLEKISKAENPPMWVACPDVVGNARATHKLFREWEPVIRSKYGLKVALVLQNGQESIGVPWQDIDAIFIGGDDAFKYSKHVAYLVKKARALGLEAHMGRVNSEKRIEYARRIGCTSVDGTGFSMFPDRRIPSFLRLLETQQGEMFAEKDLTLHPKGISTRSPVQASGSEEEKSQCCFVFATAQIGGL